MQPTLSLQKIACEKFHMNSLLSFPLRAENETTMSMSFYSRHRDRYNTGHTNLLNRLRQALVNNLSALPSLHYTNSTNKHDAKDLQESISPPRLPGFEGIIGSSHLLLKVFDHITQVAPFDTAVLLLGESGTGKERIADCIHQRSPRKNKALVKVNCAALPATLIESELFGHEKGSFTGATEKRTGRFEQANGGTIFLDEIGELPVDLQVKLLRVLQEKEIQPVGGALPVKIDVRVIAATNRNLEKEVGEGRFRLDLYYRLNVFPIELPALRERTEDIPFLANHFIAQYNRKAGKKITGLSDNVIKKMMAYHWPGNIRELENLVERGVLLAKGTVIDDINLAVEKKTVNNDFPGSQVKSINENERDYIISILRKCNGKVWGAGGAAELLNIPPTTLKSKMKKLGIEKEGID
jgi:transcriptional regulator with GAF, ATPase, and Fis domain